jgi:hypothetical protein
MFCVTAVGSTRSATGMVRSTVLVTVDKPWMVAKDASIVRDLIERRRRFSSHTPSCCGDTTGSASPVRPAPWTHPLLFAREGSAIPINVAVQSFAARADRRGFLIFPPKRAGTFTMESFEDDGESEAYRTGGYGGWRLAVEAARTSILVRIGRYGVFMGLDPDAEVIFPRGESRRIFVRRS